MTIFQNFHSKNYVTNNPNQSFLRECNMKSLSIIDCSSNAVTTFFVCLAVAAIGGCEETQVYFNRKATNKSQSIIWVQNVYYGKSDLACGFLKSGGSSEMTGPVRLGREFPSEIEVVWWTGDDSSRPEDESRIKRQIVAVTQPVRYGTTLEIWIEFGKDEVWRQVLPKGSDDD
jgi:hypothetical protein